MARAHVALQGRRAISGPLTPGEEGFSHGQSRDTPPSQVRAV